MPVRFTLPNLARSVQEALSRPPSRPSARESLPNLPSDSEPTELMWAWKEAAKLLRWHVVRLSPAHPIAEQSDCRGPNFSFSLVGTSSEPARVAEQMLRSRNHARIDLSQPSVSASPAATSLPGAGAEAEAEAASKWSRKAPLANLARPQVR